MNTAKRKKLEAAGFRIGDAEDFLGLTPEERELVSLRLKVSRMVRTLRERQNLTQKDLADRIKSSQSRVAKLESGAGDVSLDLMFRGFFAIGGKVADVIRIPKAKGNPKPAKKRPGKPEKVSNPRRD